MVMEDLGGLWIVGMGGIAFIHIYIIIIISEGKKLMFNYVKFF